MPPNQNKSPEAIGETLTGGNIYAYDINEGSPVPEFAGEDPFSAMQRAQEQQFDEQYETPQNTPNPEKTQLNTLNRESAESGNDTQEQISGFGNNPIAKIIESQPSIDIKGAIDSFAAQSGITAILSATEGNIDANASDYASTETLGVNATDGMEDGDKINHADVAARQIGAAAFKLAKARAFMQMGDKLSAQDELKSVSSLAEMADSQIKLSDNSNINKLKDAVSQLESLAADYQSKLSEGKVAEEADSAKPDGTAEASLNLGVAAQGAEQKPTAEPTSALGVAEQPKNAVIDYSVYEQATAPKAFTNPDDIAKARAAMASETSISPTISRMGDTTQSEYTYETPVAPQPKATLAEAAPKAEQPVTQTQLTPEQLAAKAKREAMLQQQSVEQNPEINRTA